MNTSIKFIQSLFRKIILSVTLFPIMILFLTFLIFLIPQFETRVMIGNFTVALISILPIIFIPISVNSLFSFVHDASVENFFATIPLQRRTKLFYIISVLLIMIGVYFALLMLNINIFSYLVSYNKLPYSIQYIFYIVSLQKIAIIWLLVLSISISTKLTLRAPQVYFTVIIILFIAGLFYIQIDTQTRSFSHGFFSFFFPQKISPRNDFESTQAIVLILSAFIQILLSVHLYLFNIKNHFWNKTYYVSTVVFYIIISVLIFDSIGLNLPLFYTLIIELIITLSIILLVRISLTLHRIKTIALILIIANLFHFTTSYFYENIVKNHTTHYWQNKEYLQATSFIITLSDVTIFDKEDVQMILSTNLKYSQNGVFASLADYATGLSDTNLSNDGLGDFVNITDEHNIPHFFYLNWSSQEEKSAYIDLIQKQLLTSKKMTDYHISCSSQLTQGDSEESPVSNQDITSQIQRFSTSKDEIQLSIAYYKDYPLTAQSEALNYVEVFLTS